MPFKLIGLLVVLVGLAVASRWTPLRELLEIDTLAATVERLAALPAAPVVVIGGFVVAGFLVIPVTALAVVTVLVFGPVRGFVYTLIGATASALAGYALGRCLGRDAIQRLAGSRLDDITQKIARTGLLAVIAARLTPIAPFTIVNIVAGAARIRLRDFVLGTVIGLMPGLIVISFFTDGIVAAIANPRPTTFALLAAIGTAVAVAAVFVRRRLRDG